MKLLLLPGLDGTGKLFEKFCGSLPSEFAAVALAYPPSLAGFDDYARFVKQQIAGVGESVVLVAESFSGPIAVEVLRHPPPNLHGLVLVSTFIQTPSPLMLAIARRLPDWLMATFSGLALDWFCLNGNEDQAMANEIRVVVKSLAPRLIRARLRILQSLPSDLPEVLAAAKLPLLFIQPQHDRLVAKKYFVQIEARVSAASTTRIACPHFLLQCRPVPCAAAIAKFARRCV